MTGPRLPASTMVPALIRQTQGNGGFATVLRKGEKEAGTILVVLTENGANSRVYERMPQADGTRAWYCARRDDSQDSGAFEQYLARRRDQDDDLWIVELDIANGERLIGLSPSKA